MRVTFKMLTGKTFALEIEAWESLESIKARIAEQEGLSPVEIRLIFAGKELTNGRTLADYNVQADSTIHVVPRRPEQA